jgi:hypothetical protein
MKRLFHDYGLSITLFALFLLFWAGQTYAGYVEYVQGDTVSYFWVWMGDTLENWESELLQLGLMVVLTTYLIHKDSPQSRDGSDKMQQTLDRIERKLDEAQQ